MNVRAGSGRSGGSGAKLREAIRIALSSPLAGRVYTIRSGWAKGLKTKGGFGFIPFKDRMTEEQRLLAQLDLRGMTIFDVGGDQGEFTLVFASASETGRVVTFEPNPESCRSILERVELNGFRNVEVRQIALGREAGRGTLSFVADDSGTGTLHPAITAHVLAKPHARSVPVRVDTLDNQVAATGLIPDLVKIDVEGLECDVLVGMARTMMTHRPLLFIEMHGLDSEAKERNAERVVRLLDERGYSVTHVESGERIAEDNAVVAKEGHLFCTPTGPAAG